MTVNAELHMSRSVFESCLLSAVSIAKKTVCIV